MPVLYFKLLVMIAALLCFLLFLLSSVLIIASTLSLVKLAGKLLSQLDTLSCSRILKDWIPSTSKIYSGIECLFSHMLLKILPKVFSFNIREFWAELWEWLHATICQQQKQKPRCMWLKCAQVDSSKMPVDCVCLDLNFAVDCYIKVKK